MNIANILTTVIVSEITAKSISKISDIELDTKNVNDIVGITVKNLAKKDV